MADAETPSHYAEAPALQYEYTDGKALMEHGPEALHEHVATRMEIALGKALPQMEVRFKNLSLSADVLVSSHKENKQELPTLVNEVKMGFRRFAPKKYMGEKHILKNVNGVFKPGTVTLILGQPGSGKSSLMKILSGRFPMDKNVTFAGDVTYNGATRDEIMKRMPQYVSYVTQRDYHFPTLTVKETLEFAHECCGAELSERAEKHFNQGTSEENKQALEAARALYKYYPEVIIHQLGLDNCQNTIVGNGMLRGVSGGERKRVTTGEMQFGNKYVTFMDEISTGLDSAATYDIIKTQRSIAKTLRKTVVIALLQPSPEVFALFDDVMILNDGYVMYHGPREQIMPYFEDLGFRCPPRRDAADYLMDLGTHQQHRYEVARADGSKHPRKAREFAEIFEKSAIHDTMLADLHGPHDPMLLEYKENHFDKIPEFHQSFLESTATLIARQLKIVLRNKSFIRSRGIMVLLIGFIYSTVFWQFDVQNAQVVMGIIFQAVLFLALGQASQIPTYIAARQIFYKQRASNFYRTASYVLACSVAQLPIAALETIVFGTMVYWMCGFVASAGAFILFELLLFLTNLSFGACFFLLAAIAPDLHVAKPMSMVAIMIFVLFAGFVVPANQIPDYLIWVYWLNPISWCVRAVGINEYRHKQFDKAIFNGFNYEAKYGRDFGAYSLSLFDVKSGKEWLPYGFIFLICSYVFFMWLSYLVLEYIRYESPEHVTLGGEDDVKEVDPLSDSSSTGSEYGLIQTPRGDNRNKGELAVEVEQATRERYFKPVTLTFKDLRYSVPNPTNPKEDLELLKGISGFATPGTITALMGSSGAGKTTLMDVIAGRKTGGKIQGKILLNGHEATDLAIRRSTGYCEQMDIHSEAATIREALTFSAFLRQDAGVPDAQKYDSVEEVLELLDMLPIADQIIRGSSVEQMKRLTIGVELAAQPSVLFLDEPTSGLDARSAKVIMDGVRKVADSGRTIVCTIHQPSSEVFSVFDSLLLLKRGGETVYFGQVGENASELIQYFESIPGTQHLPENYNPATWMLEVTGAGVGNAVTHDFVKIFNESEKKKALELALEQDGFLRPAPGVQALEYPTKRAALESVQAKFLIQRFFAMYWRTPSYNLTRFVVYVLQALIFGLTFAGANYASYQGINAGEGMVFMTSLFLGVVSFNSILPLSCQERPSFYRERAAQTYNALWYFVGATIVEIPYVLSSTLLYNIIFFPMVGFTGVARFFSYWIVTSLMVLIQAYIGQLLAFALPSVEVAAISGVMVNSIFFLFMGFNPPASAIPKAYKWLYYITPHRYGLSVLSAIVFGDCPDPSKTSELACKPLDNLPPALPKNLNIKGYVEKVFDMKYDDIWMNLGILIGFIVLVRLLAAYALRYINHQKR